MAEETRKIVCTQSTYQHDKIWSEGDVVRIPKGDATPTFWRDWTDEDDLGRREVQTFPEPVYHSHKKAASTGLTRANAGERVAFSHLLK